MSSNIENQLSRRIRHFLSEHDLAKGALSLVVGVSGGADSVSLIHVLSELRNDLDINLHIGHLNHQLRGTESDDDAEFVSELARQLGIPATIEKRDVASYRIANRCSLEEAGREVRYMFLADIAQYMGEAAIAVGHTADDQSETILLHLIRGTGATGLRGMRPFVRWRLPDGRQISVLRPLLDIERVQTEAYCLACNLSPRYDSTNMSSRYLRNRIRLELMPLLREFNPNIGDSLSRAGQLIAGDSEYITARAEELRDLVITEREDGIIISNDEFLSLSPSLQRYLLRSALERFRGNLRDIEFSHIEALTKILVHPANKRLSLPGELSFQGGYSESFIGRGDFNRCPWPVLEEDVRLVVPGTTVFSGRQVHAEIREGNTKITDTEYEASFDLDLVGEGLMVRSRRNGDRFQPLGMSNPKKIQDFMVDAKIPRDWRDRVPLVCSPDRIIWVVGWRIDHRVRVTPSTKRVLVLKFTNGT